MRSDIPHIPPTVPSAPPPERSRPRPRVPRWVFIFLGLVLVLAGIGFIVKLIDFTKAWNAGGTMEFAIIPVVTYFVVAAGYVCLFLWSFGRGAFKDIEGPKYRMLEMQAEFDAQMGNDNQ